MTARQERQQGVPPPTQLPSTDLSRKPSLVVKWQTIPVVGATDINRTVERDSLESDTDTPTNTNQIQQIATNLFAGENRAVLQQAVVRLSQNPNARVTSLDAAVLQYGVLANHVRYIAHLEEGNDVIFVAYIPKQGEKPGEPSELAEAARQDWNDLQEFSAAMNHYLTPEGQAEFFTVTPLAAGETTDSEGATLPFYLTEFIPPPVGEVHLDAVLNLKKGGFAPYFAYAIPPEDAGNINDTLEAAAQEKADSIEARPRSDIVMYETPIFQRQRDQLFTFICLIYLLGNRRLPQGLLINSGNFMGAFSPTGISRLTFMTVRGGWSDPETEDVFFDHMANEHYEPVGNVPLFIFREQRDDDGDLQAGTMTFEHMQELMERAKSYLTPEFRRKFGVADSELIS